MTAIDRINTTAAIVFVLAVPLGVVAQDVAAQTIKPDHGIQASLRGLLEANEKDNDYVRFFRYIMELQIAADKNPIEVARQLIWYQAYSAKEKEMTVVMVLAHVGVSDRVVGVAAPLFGHCSDAKLEAGVETMLSVVERESGPGSTFPNEYGSYVRGHVENRTALDEPFVAYIFRRYPGPTLQAFALAAFQDQRRQPFLWARHVIDDLLWKRQFGFVPDKLPDADVTEQLKKMRDRDEWWARLYAAEIIHQNPELGTPEIVEQLKSDKNEIVRKAIAPDEKAKP